MAFSKRQADLFDEAARTYKSVIRHCQGKYSCITENLPGIDKSISWEMLSDIQLQYLLLQLAFQYEEDLEESEQDFIRSIVRWQDLKERVVNYRSFIKKISAETFSHLDGDILSFIRQTPCIPYGILIALNEDGRDKDENVSAMFRYYIHIFVDFLALTKKERQKKREALDDFYNQTAACIHSKNDRFGDVKYAVMLDSAFSKAEEEEAEESQEKEKSLDDLLGELDELIGLEGVKANVRELINYIAVRKERERRGYKNSAMSLHMVFVGNPGTGKTTVARLIAQIYKAMGVLSTGQLVEADRSELVGGYVGQSELKTREVIEHALGGVLFIDEAYSLVVKDSPNDYGKEIVSTLLKQMEDKRGQFVVIAAGYPKLMEDFLEANPGLKSRFNTTIQFDNYDAGEMHDIFNLLCKKDGYRTTLNADEQIGDILTDYVERFGDSKEFANGRDVRNLYEKIVRQQAKRIYRSLSTISDEELMKITEEDVSGISIR